MPNAAPISLHTKTPAPLIIHGVWMNFGTSWFWFSILAMLVDFGETFRFQLFHQVFHISVQRFLGKHVLKGKKPRLF